MGLINISDKAMKSAIVANPIAMSEIFRKISYDVIFSILFGMKPENVTRSTILLHKRNPGVFGLVNAVFQTNEEQGQGTTHGHSMVWGNLSPYILQACVSIEELLNTAISIIDNMICSKLSPKMHMEKMLNNFQKQRPAAPNLYPSHNPIYEPTEFQNDVDRVISTTNIHTHSFTCHKGKIGKRKCRMSYPQNLCEHTRCVQLIPIPGSTKKDIDYEISTNLKPPIKESLPYRDISRIPVRQRNNNFY